MKSRHFIFGMCCLISTLAVPFLRSWASSESQNAAPAERRMVCALSDKQQTEAPKAFAKMAPTFLHPRCVNCHGVVNALTGENHEGGAIKPGIDPETQQNDPFFRCPDCHVKGWMTPEPRFSFKGRDAVRLCRKMKAFMDSADVFMGHISRDATLTTPFIQISFTGTRGLTEEGRDFYEGSTQKKFVPEPPPISHETFVSQAQAWVDAMGGKFRGDWDCGCVPHHYTLSIDMHAVQDNHRGSTAYYVEQSGHVEIPLDFKDDGSFESEGQMPWKQSGSTHTPYLDCTLKGNIDLMFKVKGTVDEDKQVLHLVFGNNIIGGSTTNTCSNGMNTTRPFSGTHDLPEKEWDMSAFVGEQQNVPMPYQDAPGFTSGLKLRINQTD